MREISLEINREEFKNVLDIKDGKDYVLTSKDKQDIADSITVPVVEKVIEKITEKVEVIKEQPIVTEVALYESPFVIADKLLSIKKEWFPIDSVKGLRQELARKTNYVVGAGSNSLKSLVDVDYSGLTQDANGNYILGGGGSWGSITGTLSDQTDLQSALNLKADLTDLSGYGVAGVDTEVQFNNSGTFGADSNFRYNSAYGQLTLGLDTVATSYTNQPFTIGGNTNNYFGGYIQNLSTGDTASADFILGANNDDTAIAGHYVNLGVNGSNYVGTSAATGIIKTVSIHTAGTGYTVGDLLTLVGGDGTGEVEVLTVSGGAVTSVKISFNGTGYTVTNFATSFGTGTGCRINVLTLYDLSGLLANDTYLIGEGGNLDIGTSDAVASKSVRFFTNGFATANERMRIDSTGKVGIGTTIPTSKLQVKGFTANDVVSSDAGYNINTIAPPVGATIALQVGAGVTAGAHTYKITYYTAIGETNAGNTTPLAVTTDAVNGNVLVGIPISSDPAVIGRKIYRTKTGQTSDRGSLVATVANNTATTYLDAIPDASLGADSWATYRPNTTSKYISVNGVRSMVIDPRITTLGVGAGASVTEAPFSTFIGASAGGAVTSGQANVFIGDTSGRFTTTGSNNIAIGGYLTLYSNATGAGNTVVGYQSGRYITTNSNTILGNSSGNFLNDGVTQLTAPTNGIYIGVSAKGFAAAEGNAIVIGVSALGLGSNTTVIGNSSTTKTVLWGNLGLGTTAPISKIDSLASGTKLVVGDTFGIAGNFEGAQTTAQASTVSISSNAAVAADIGGVLAFGGNYNGTGYANWAAIKGLKHDATSGNYGGYLAFYTRTTGAASAERMRIDTTGNVAIGTNSATNKLTIETALTSVDTIKIKNITNLNGYASIGFYNYLNTQVGGFGYGNNVSGVANDSVYFYSVAKNIVFSKDQTTTAHLAINGTTGNVGIGNILSATAKLDIDSDIVRLRTAKTPASATATGNQGDICWDADYMYVCVAANTWKRSAIATW